MNIKIFPGKLTGVISAPPSKSYTHRSILLASLARGDSTISNLLLSQDTRVTISACQKLGAKLILSKNVLKVRGTNGFFHLKRPIIKIFCGNSGTTTRLILSAATLANGEIILDGKRRLRERPISELVETLQRQGIKVVYLRKEGCLPVKIKGGHLKGGVVILSGSTSSQFISSLLIVSPFAQRDVAFHVTGLVSKPYVDITIELMKLFGVKVERDNHAFNIAAGQSYKACKYEVEGDYTSASYFLAGAAITKSKVTVKNLKDNSKQGDSYFLRLLEKMGGQIRQDKEQITVVGDKLSAISADLSDYPDIVPTIAIVAACANGVTTLTNIGNLRQKESDRIKALADGLKRMGIKTKTTHNSLVIRGGKLNGAEIETYNDHRVALSFAIAALKASHETIIKNAEVVAKSYPTFFADFKKVGGKVIL